MWGANRDCLFFGTVQLEELCSIHTCVSSRQAASRDDEEATEEFVNSKMRLKPVYGGVPESNGVMKLVGE
ncbi:hypothetical protein MHYP_G00000900 [Metynnis hypsauchen]